MESEGSIPGAKRARQSTLSFATGGEAMEA
jgi:hypothetical protein